MDSALFAAIVSDFDLTSAASVNDLCTTLDAIRESALEQEGLPFDPSGTAASAPIDDISATSSPNGDETSRTKTDTSGLTSPLLSSNGGSQAGRSKGNLRAAYTVTADGSLEFSGASFEENVNALLEMFPSVSHLNIEHSLKKSGGDPTKAMDVLLNLAFFDETQATQDGDHIVMPKGIDGFLFENGIVGRQKGRKKQQKSQKFNLTARSPSTDAPAPNKWENGRADIEYICSRTPELSERKITSLYHANGMKLAPTLRAIAAANAPKDLAEIDDDPVMLTQVGELAGSFPHLSATTLVGLLRVTRNLPSAANDLATVMSRRPSLTDAAEVIKFTATPLNLGDDEGTSGPRSRQGKTAVHNLDYDEAQAAAEAHFAAGSAAYQQAAQAARRAKSNPLYGGASAYYREMGQEHRARAMQQLGVASDRLVDRQSTNCDLDLHGVTVPNAIRIVRERVSAWWDALGDTKYVRGGGKHIHGGYKIVTGIGNHSHDGTSRLGPAVSRMLMQEGWRVEVGRGFVTVTGVARA